ncbi:hypothetical protein AVEN_245600-1 [Araneus ventricosus]|uniref:Uncharacterized protein n=1 Tax=Araneus ventricosus TaxID=182803 RepID=A0A4Y2ITJ0_ARAVE|nr:hypothetical protein AVEN_245600-1 [Araneus ventricosus]
MKRRNEDWIQLHVENEKLKIVNSCIEKIEEDVQSEKERLRGKARRKREDRWYGRQKYKEKIEEVKENKKIGDLEKRLQN